MKKNLKKSKKGFTLIELVVVIAILGILAAILIPVIGGFIERANIAADTANARNLYNSSAMLFSIGQDADDPALLADFIAVSSDGSGWDVVIGSDGILSATYGRATYKADGTVSIS